MTALRVLVIGGGGREHALAWKVAQSSRVERVLVAPGNAGTAFEPKVANVAVKADDLDGLLALAKRERVDLTIVGPEQPLVAGIVDRFREAGLRVFGPTAAAAQLEGSKAFAKDFLHRHGIPTARYGAFTEVGPAVALIRELGAPVVVKADGLAAGKGVVVAESTGEAEAAVNDMLSGNAWWSKNSCRARKRASSASSAAAWRCRSRRRRTTSAVSTATWARTRAAWAHIHPRRS
jgi:phosphoribosylamine---glycine ligase